MKLFDRSTCIVLKPSPFLLLKTVINIDTAWHLLLFLWIGRTKQLGNVILSLVVLTILLSLSLFSLLGYFCFILFWLFIFIPPPPQQSLWGTCILVSACPTICPTFVDMILPMHVVRNGCMDFSENLYRYLHLLLTIWRCAPGIFILIGFFFSSILLAFLYPPQTKLRGYIVILMSVRSSVRPSLPISISLLL